MSSGRETRYRVGVHGLVQRDGELLVLRRSASECCFPGAWDLPGGRVEAGEQLGDALGREVREETGLEVQVGELLFAHTHLAHFPEVHAVQLVYRCQGSTGQIRLDPEEHVDFAWLPPDRLQELDFVVPMLERARTSSHLQDCHARIGTS